jgi:Tol biopolymer transport system component
MKLFDSFIDLRSSLLIGLCVSISWYGPGADAQDRLDDATLIVSARDLSIRGELAHLSFSPANPDILTFESIEGGNLHRLWLLDLSSDTLRQVSPHPAEEFFYDARSDRDIHWCPVPLSGKNWFLFVSSGYDGIENIYLSNTVDSVYMQLTSDNAVDHHPRWSPDCGSIVYVSSRTGNGDLYKIDNVYGLVSLFEQNLRDSDPDNNDNGTIVIDGYSNGGEHIRLTTSSEMDSYPEWSPDGRFIVYQGLVRTGDILNIDLFLLDLHNQEGKPLNITNDPEWDIIQPQWSYDQKSIAYYMSAVGIGDMRSGVLYLSYLTIEEGNPNTFEIRKRSEFIDINVKRSVNTGPFWGPGSRSLVYVKGEGTYTPILYFPTSNDTLGTEPLVLRESSIDVINREVAGVVKDEDLRIAYLTYEDQDYRVYLVYPAGDILGHDPNDVYTKPLIPRVFNPASRNSLTFLASAAVLGVHGQTGPGMLQMLRIPEISGYVFTNFSESRIGSMFEPGVRVSLGQLRSGYLSNTGEKTPFGYNYMEASLIASVVLRNISGAPRLFFSGGIGYGLASAYILRAAGWKSYYIPLTGGIMYSLLKNVEVIPFVSFRRIHYKVYEEVQSVFTGTVGLGIAFRFGNAHRGR